MAEVGYQDLRPKLKINRRLCPHCDCLLSTKTYRVHKRLYFNDQNGTWKSPEVLDCDISEPEHSDNSPPQPLSPSDFNAASSSSSSDDDDGANEHDDILLFDDDDDDDDDSEDDADELWDIDESVLQDLNTSVKPKEVNEPPEDITAQAFSTNIPSEALILSRWIVAFVSFIQATYQLSDGLVTLCISFFKVLFSILGNLSSICLRIAKALPSSLYELRRLNGTFCLNFIRYVVCKKCHMVYKFSDCVTSTFTSKTCSYKAYPNHPHARMRQPCNNLLLTTVEISSGKKILYPFMTYCYIGLILPLEKLLKHDGICDSCELWHHRNLDGQMRNIYDGKLWKEFMNYEGVLFLSEPLSFAFMINVDWFQPYKNVQYSVGVIYLSLLNLSRSIRNKPNKVICDRLCKKGRCSRKCCF